MNWRVCVMVALLGIAGLMPLSAQPEMVNHLPVVVKPLPAVANPLQVNDKRAWGPEQATGAPDTAQAGDFPTAWASLQPDGGPEWLQLDYAHAVAVKEVRIRESYNPGAVVKVTAFGDDGKEKTLWEGEDPTKKAPEDFVVKPAEHFTTKRVKVYLDTTRVPGWNEIDAVELVGADETRQWAVSATASSTYAVRPPGDMPMIDVVDHPVGDEFQAFLNRPVVCHLPGGTNLDGVLQRNGPQFLVIRNDAAHLTYVVNKVQIIFAEIKPAPPVVDEEKLR